jgi:transposase
VVLPRTTKEGETAMTEKQTNRKDQVLVAIDIAKKKHDILIELPSGKRRKFVIQNTRSGFQSFFSFLKDLEQPCLIGIEPTADYHRNLAYFLQIEGFEVKLVSSIAVARTREALHNSWDKNDPKDAQVILHLLKTGVVQRFYDPVLNGTNDLQELSKTHYQVSMRKTRLQHSILNHYIPLYFPEAEKFLRTTRAGWFGRLLLEFPLPSTVCQYSQSEFIEKAAQLVKTKHSKESMLTCFYDLAQESTGIPVKLDSKAVATFRLILQEHQDLTKKRADLEKTAHDLLKDNEDYKILRTVPGIGPIIALSILAEAGDLRRFGHERQFLKFCGLDLSTSQSGAYRGISKISKRGNGRLRSSLWMAATVAIRMQENSFRKKFTAYVKSNPNNKDLKRRAYTAVTAKMARVVYGLIKHKQVYRSYFEEAIPDGRTRSDGPLRQMTS